MQCKVEKRVVRRQKVVGVECFKYKERRHKYRECLLWKKIEKKGVKKAAYVVIPQKAQQKKLRGIKEEEAVHMAKLQEA